MTQFSAITYDEMCNYAGGSQCVNEGQFILKLADLFVAEQSGKIVISNDAKQKLRERFLKNGD